MSSMSCWGRTTISKSLSTSADKSGGRSIAAALPIFLTLILIGCAQRRDDHFPNAPVILISIDTLRADHLSAYGAKRVQTPAIDRLATDGIIFENAYAHVP